MSLIKAHIVITRFRGDFNAYGLHSACTGQLVRITTIALDNLV